MEDLERRVSQAPSSSSKAGSVKNKAPAKIQVTAEQILREALDYQDSVPPAPKRSLTDLEELEQFRLEKRKNFEDVVRRQKFNLGVWIKYALFEASQNEFERARSVFERALDVEYRSPGLWVKYAEMEMKNKFLNRARNVWDRAVALLPRVDQLWLKYTLMEENVGNIQGARQVFERWMKWAPDYKAWNVYLQLEYRQKNWENARHIFERFLVCHPVVATYLKYAKFEEKHGSVAQARAILERCSNELGEESETSSFFSTFAQFEERYKEFERAKVIFEYGLEKLRQKAEALKQNGGDDKSQLKVAEEAADLYSMFIRFQKHHGSVDSVDSAVFDKRRMQYEDEIKHSSGFDYDVWFDYIKLEKSAIQSHQDFEKVREIFERAIANIPQVEEKRLWRRYIYLWINYAVFEELVTCDIGRAREVYQACLDLIPHKKFTFAKIWWMFAEFELRQLDLKRCRRILGTSLGRCPKAKIFRKYIELELELGEIDRCRTLFEKWLEFSPEKADVWIRFANLEESLGELDRVRGIFELVLGHSEISVDNMDVIWKSYIDFETNQNDFDRVRNLYDRFIEQSKGAVKVWISKAQFEASIEEIEKARAVFEVAESWMKTEKRKEDRALILQALREFEKEFGSEKEISEVESKLPQRIKRKRRVLNQDGSEAGFEEYYDYVFPDELAATPALKILQAAKKWKQSMSNK